MVISLLMSRQMKPTLLTHMNTSEVFYVQNNICNVELAKHNLTGHC